MKDFFPVHMRYRILEACACSTHIFYAFLLLTWLCGTNAIRISAVLGGLHLVSLVRSSYFSADFDDGKARNNTLRSIKYLIEAKDSMK